jgi:hypothetical protein
VKHVRFTGPDRRVVANALEAMACLEGISMNELLERILREAIQRDPRVRPPSTPTRDEGVTIEQSQPSP